MAYKVKKVEMWTGEIDDRVGGLADKLEILAEAGVDLEVIVARRKAQFPEKGIVFLGPLSGARGKKAAVAAGLSKSADLVVLRVEGINQQGDCYRLARLLAEAGISLRGLSATALGNKYAISLGFDSDADAARATRILQGPTRNGK